MQVSQQVVRRFRSQLLWRLCLKYSLALITVWLFAWGTAVLVMRAVAGADGVALAWGLIGVGPAAVIGVVLAVRKLPGVRVLRATVDNFSRAGGLLMAAQETAIGDWSARVEAVKLPAVAWDGRKAWGMTGLAALFVAVSFLVPQRFIQPAEARPLDVTAQTQTLAEQLETLKDQKLVEEQRAQQMKEKLDQVMREAMADNPARTFESLDHLKQTLAQIAEQAADKTIREAQKMGQAEALAEAVASDQQLESPELDAAKAGEALAMLNQMLDQMTAQNPGLAAALDKAGIKPKELMQQAAPMRQAFISSAVDPRKRGAVEQVMREKGIDPAQMGLLDQASMDDLKDALRDNKATSKRFETLRKKLGAKLNKPADLPSLSDDQLHAIEDALQKEGVIFEQYALLSSEEAKKAGGPRKLTPDQIKELQKLAQQMREGKGDGKGMMDKLAGQRLIDPRKLSQLDKAGECDGKGLAKFLAECEGGKGGMKEGMSEWCDKPGNGGLSRGRGDAKMSWGDQKNDEGATFKPQVLPQGDLRSLQDSHLTGLSLGAPKVDGKTGVDQSAALGQAQAGGGSATKQPILPRHRETVEKYFERK